MTYTQTGTRWTLNITSRIVPGKLIFTGIHGKLVGSLTIDQLSYQKDKTKITADDIELSWKPTELLFGRLKIDQLIARNIQINLAPISKETSATPVFVAEILRGHFPLALQLHNIAFNKITITHKNLPKPIIINILTINLHTTHRYIKSAAIDLKAPNALLQINGQLHKQYNFNWKINIKNLAELFPETTGSIISQGQVTGTKAQPKVHATLKVVNLSYATNKIGSLQSDINLDLSTNKTSLISLTAKQMSFGQYAVNRIALKSQIITTLRKATPVVTVNVQFAPTTISLLSDYQTHELTLQRGQLHATISNKGLSSELHITPQNQADIDANLNIDKSKHLKGEIKWHTKTLNFLTAMFPKITKSAGKLDVDIKLFGTLLKPKFAAHITLKNATASIPSLNLNLKNIQLNLVGDTSALNYKAELTSGSGSLTIAGKTALDRKHFPSEISITGKNCLINNTDTIKIYASPNLKVLLDTNHLDANGTITIPKADVQPRDFSSVTTLPNDVVFVDKRQQKMFIKKEAFKVSYNIKLILGEHININAMNLTGRLIGQLQVQDQSQGATAAGSLYIKNGRYNIYGQPLTIESGSLNFTGGPISNPLIDVSAIRTFKSTDATTGGDMLTVGAHIQGRLNHPRTTLFSSPIDLSNEDIVSYLVLGQPAAHVGSNKLDLLLRAVQALNFGGSGSVSHITGSIRNKLGLSELGVETEANAYDRTSKKTTSKTSVVIGKYLSPSLYVGYSYGFMDKENTFRVRYKLWKGLYIQTEGSTTSSGGLGGDLLYNFNK